MDLSMFLPDLCQKQMISSCRSQLLSSDSTAYSPWAHKKSIAPPPV